MNMLGALFRPPRPSCGIPECKRPCNESGGVVFDYCGRTHAKEAASRMLTAGAGQQHRTCHLDSCSKQVFFCVSTNRIHDFCSKSHAEEAITKGQWVPGRNGRGTSKCMLPGCQEDVYRDPITALVSDFCSRGHRDHVNNNRKGVTTVNRHVDRVIIGRIAGSTNFVLSVLKKTHPQYSSLESQFTSKWMKSGVPTVRSILEVRVPTDVLQKTETYKRNKGNVRRRFHGTSCSAQCSFFVDLKGNPCGRKECNVCSICTHGFCMLGNVGQTARRTSFGLRYGDGLYFSSVSGKANDYASLSEKVDSGGKRLRCAFVANVAAGKTYKTTQIGLQTPMCPPNGYNSVVGEVGAGLNYDELVVYNNEAALPTHMIVYALP